VVEHQLPKLSVVGSIPIARSKIRTEAARRQRGKIMDQRTDQPSERQRGWSWWYLLFVIQFVAVLWPPFYNKAEPTLIGMPFFYWYQLLCVIIGAALTAIVYFAAKE
jgi:hypothetical protein